MKYKNYTIYCLIGLFLFSLFSITLASSTKCETKEECVRESAKEKRRRIESGEIDTTPTNTHEYTYNVEYRFSVYPGDTVWEQIKETHDDLTPDSLDQWFENERIEVLNALKNEGKSALRVMGFSSGSIDLIYPAEKICFKALHHRKKALVEGELVEDSNIIFDIKSCR